MNLSSTNHGPLLVTIISTDLFSYSFHKVQPGMLTNGLLEDEIIIYYFFVGDKRVSEVGNIFWQVIFNFFMVDQLG